MALAGSTVAASSAAKAVREVAFALKLYPLVGVLAVGISFGSAFLGYPVATLQGRLVTEPLAPPAVNVPDLPAPTPPIVDPHVPAVASNQVPLPTVPGDRIPEGLPIASTHKLLVYLMNSDSAAPFSPNLTLGLAQPLQKLGEIEHVQVGNDGKVTFYIVNVGDWFGSEKDIAVPSQKVTWLKGQNYWTKQDAWTPVVSMTKADVQNAPKQIFDPAANKWSPAQ